MGVFKEEFYELCEIAKRQYPIYPDACDLGIEIEHFDHPQCIAMQDIIDRMPDSCKKRSEYRRDDIVAVTWTLTFEWDDDNIQTFHCKYFRNNNIQMIQIY